MKIFENIINHKVNTITGTELSKYAKQFNISVTEQQSEQIAQYLKGKKVNIFNDIERTELIKEIAKVAGPKTAREVNKIFIQFTSMGS